MTRSSGVTSEVPSSIPNPDPLGASMSSPFVPFNGNSSFELRVTGSEMLSSSAESSEGENWLGGQGIQQDIGELDPAGLPPPPAEGGSSDLQSLFDEVEGGGIGV